jgi:hypothetical protein
MSQGFEGFSKAAKLYAEYAEVVDEMREQFESNISDFLDALRDRLSSEIREGRLKEERGSDGCSWWIESNAGEDDVAYVWFRTNAPDTVSPGSLEFRVYADEASDDDRRQLATLLGDPNRHWPQPAVAKKGTNKCVLALSVGYGEADPVSVAVKPVTTLLQAVKDSYEKLKSGKQ